MAKILFLANSLAPGRDGVGDVTRLLADYLEQHSCQCTLIAICDPHLPHAQEEKVSARSGLPQLVQLSSRLSWEERTRRTRGWIEKIQPDLISLQFVAYALQVKGIVFPAIPYLERMVRGYPLHVMFHELWVGAERGASWKHRLMGALQRMAIQKCLQRLQPRKVHASNPTYVALLRQAGIAASRLPIASGIPLADKTGHWMEQELLSHGISIDSVHRQDYIIFGHFGTLHSVWPPEPLLSLMVVACHRLGKKPLLLGVGRLGQGQLLWNQIAFGYQGRMAMVHLGVRSDLEISQFFNVLDYGIAATPWQIIGKSSVAVAMLEHGLPVIVNRELRYGLPESDQDPGEPGLLRMGDQFVDQLVAGVPRRPPQSRLPEIARIFLKDNALVPIH